MDDSRDTLIVTGCTGMTGKQFIETMLVFGKLKINDDGSNMSRILPEKGIGIVTFEKPEMAETARGMLNGQEIHGNTLTVLTAAEFFKTAKPLKGTNDRYGINMAWQMWNNNIENAGGKGGKGGSGFLGGMLKGQDGKPGQPGPNGKGGEGGKGGLGFFSGWLTGRNGKDGDGVTCGKGENGSFGKGKDGTDWGDGNRESMGCGKGGKGGFGKGKDGQSWRGNADQDKCESGGKSLSLRNMVVMRPKGTENKIDLEMGKMVAVFMIGKPTPMLVVQVAKEGRVCLGGSRAKTGSQGVRVRMGKVEKGVEAVACCNQLVSLINH